MAYIDCTKTREKNLTGLKDGTQKGFIFAVIAFCLDLTGLFCLAVFFYNADAKRRCKETGNDTMLPTIGMVVSGIGVARAVIMLCLLPVVFLAL